MAVQRIALGIGNPGPEYTETRHNIGFMVLDLVAARCGLTFQRLERREPDGTRRFGGRCKAQFAAGGAGGGDWLLVKPLTYVNLSGDVAGPLLRAHALGPAALFVVVDDLSLPLGRIRVRPSGSSGGHNGLASIEAALGTREYPRLRLGIGEPRASSVDHVLTRFLPEEREVLGRSLERAAAAVTDWLGGRSIPDLMDLHNGWCAEHTGSE